MKLLTLFVLIFISISIIGCAKIVPQLAKDVIVKTHMALTNVELVIQNIDPTNVVENTQKLKLPLEVTKKALTFINNKINNPDINIELDKALLNIGTVLEVIKTANKDNIEELKTELTIQVIDLKVVVEETAKYLKIDLPVMSSLATSNEECIEDLERVTTELSSLLD